jgi:hypothetical protein
MAIPLLLGVPTQVNSLDGVQNNEPKTESAVLISWFGQDI